MCAGIQIPPPWKTKSAEHTAATTGDITTTKSADTSSSRKNKKSSRRQNTVSAQLERKAKERELRQKQKETLIKLLSQNGIVVLPGGYEVMIVVVCWLLCVPAICTVCLRDGSV